MKLSVFALGLTALVGSVVGDADADHRADRLACSKKSQYAVEAINQYCGDIQANSLVIPSTQARTIKYSTGNVAAALIDGSCKPPQWLPADICFNQFFNMCATGDKLGNSRKDYGDNGCQHWQLTVSNPKHKKGYIAPTDY